LKASSKQLIVTCFTQNQEQTAQTLAEKITVSTVVLCCIIYFAAIDTLTKASFKELYAK